MCLMCDITGRDYYHNHLGNNNTPIKTRDNNNSEEKILNFNDGNNIIVLDNHNTTFRGCLLYTSPSPRDRTRSRMPSSA